MALVATTLIGGASSITSYAVSNNSDRSGYWNRGLYNGNSYKNTSWSAGCNY